jgi:hypothetical protein
MKLLFQGGLLFLIASQPAIASIVLVDALRSTDASYDYVGAPTNSSDNAGQTVNHLAALSFVAEVFSPAGSPRVHSRAQQDSTISTAAIVGNGAALVDASVGPGNAAALAAQSHFSLTFEILASIDFVLEYELSATLDTAADALPGGFASVLLFGTGGSIVDAGLSNFTGAIAGPIAGVEVGTLAPGLYTLIAEADQVLDVSAPHFLGSGQSSFDVSLTFVPEPNAALLLCLLAFAARPNRQ